MGKDWKRLQDDMRTLLFGRPDVISNNHRKHKGLKPYRWRGVMNLLPKHRTK